MRKGLLSIIMVCYNHAAYLREAIDSILRQTYHDWELIVVDDGSQDSSLFLINGYKLRFPDKVKLFIHQDNRNLGIIASYALAVKQCNGEFVSFLEPDDEWEENNAQLKIEALRNYPAVLVYSNVKPIGEIDCIKNKRLILKLIVSLPHNIPFRGFPRILFYNFIPSFSAVFVKRESLISIKFLSRRECPIWLDWFFWFQISLHGRFLFIKQELVKWRLYKRSYCATFQSNGGLGNAFVSKIRFRIRLLRETF